MSIRVPEDFFDRKSMSFPESINYPKNYKRGRGIILDGSHTGGAKPKPRLQSLTINKKKALERKEAAEKNLERKKPSESIQSFEKKERNLLESPMRQFLEKI